MYVQPLESALKDKPIITKEEINDIFGNIQEVLTNNTKFLQLLNHEIKKPFAELNLGKIFLETFEAFKKVYSQNLSLLNKSRVTLKQIFTTNKKFETFYNKKREDNRQKGLNLDSFLIKPFQRITKYHLLLRAIIEFTPLDHKYRNGNFFNFFQFFQYFIIFFQKN